MAKASLRLLTALMLLLSGTVSFAATKTATTTGNWSNASIWSPSGIPAASDDIIINSGVTVTVDSVFICNNLSMGSSTASAATLKITAAGNSLTVNGNLDFNAQNKNASYTIDAGPGAISFNGTFSHWSTTGTNKFKIGTGEMSFAAAVAITDGSQQIQFTGAGTVNFNSHFSDAQNNITFYAGCSINFYGNYTVTGTNVDWGGKGTANFYGTGTITDTKNITLYHVNIMNGANTTIVNGAGSLVVTGNLVVNTGGTVTINEDMQLNGSLVNNGTLSFGSVTITLNGSAQSISGTSSINLPNVTLGTSGNDVSVTLSKSATISNLTFSAANKNRTFALSSSSVTLTVTGNITIKQPTAKKKSNILSVGAGICTISGNLVFQGTNNASNSIAKVDVTSGSFTLNGSLTWMSNTSVATEVITTTTGTLTFANSVTMGSGSGTIKATGSGTINFNGTTAPSLSFGGSTAPVLSTAYGSTVKFAKGLTATTTTLTFAVGSTQIFNGTGTLTPTAAITFGHFQVNSGYTLTLAGNISVKGNWTNNGTINNSSYTVTMNGNSVQNISSATSPETFYKLTISPAGTTIRMLNDVTVTNTFTMSGANLDMNGYTFQLGNGSGATLSYTTGQAYGGTFKRYWPASTAITSTSGNYYGLFPLGTYSQARPLTINSTSNPTTGGYVMASHTDILGSTNVTYTDNEGSAIEAVSLQHSDVSTSGLAGGTYNIGVKFSGFGNQGNVSNLKLLTYTGNVLGSCGTHTTTSGPIDKPTAYRTGLSVTNLNNAWVIGTNNKTLTPLYQYVYSRKSGNWNDAGADGTWSFTPGGSGAACSCVPTSSGYAAIESGHTVTVTTTTDSVNFLDINSGGTLIINSGKKLTALASVETFGTGNFTVNSSGSLLVGNELKLNNSNSSPTVNGDVTTLYFTLPAGAAYTQTAGTLTVTADLELSGALSIGSSGSFALTGSNTEISGTGTFTTAAGGSFPVTNNKIVMPGTSLTIGTSGTNTTLSLAANTTVNNMGTITVNGNITGADASTSIWVNNANSAINVTGTLLSTGLLDAEISPNVVNYSGTGSQTIKVPVTAYSILSMSNGGTKTPAGDFVVNDSVYIGGSTIFDESTHLVTGDANLTMEGTSELKLSRSVEEVYPELNGIYNLSGGTVTIYQTADSAILRGATYYNLKLNGTQRYDMSNVTNITNDLLVQNSAVIKDNSELTIGGTFAYSSSGSSVLDDSITVNGILLTAGTLNDGGFSINVNGAGGWTRNAAATFTPTNGIVYFTGGSNQTLGGTATTQNFYGLCVDKSANTLTVGGSTTTLSIAGDVYLNTGTFDKGTATNINMTGGNWNNNGGIFTPGTGTVTFNSTSVDQAIQGLANTETFNNLTVNKSGYTLAVGGGINTINLNGNMTLTAGTFNAGTATNINMTAGNWTNNGATFTPQVSTVTFSGTGAQAINGTAASQTFNKLTVNKSSNTLSVSGSTTTLTLNSDLTLNAGTFDKGTATTINVAGDWVNNGGTFTYGTGTVNFNGTTAQAIKGTAPGQTFYNLTVNKSADTLSISGSTATVTVNNTLTFTNGLIKTGANKISIPTTASVSGAGAGKYIYGNEEIYIPNSAAPSKTFHIGDAAAYTPVTVAFTGTCSGSGSVTASTATGDDADITNSGIDSSKSVNRTWTLTNNGVAGFTSYAPTFTFVAGDVDGSANTANFIVRRYTSGSWNVTTAGTRTATTTQCTGETAWGRFQVGEANPIAVTTQPSNTIACEGYSASFTSASTSTPTPTVKWQRDPNTGTFADITGGMDGGVYSNFTSTTLNISNVTGLNNYKYRAVFTNINGSATSNQATLTVNASPTITGTAPNSRCDAGTVELGATASAGTINWYADSTGGASLGSGTSYTTPSIASTTTYYVDATDNGCTTASRTAVTATVTAPPTITGTTPNSRCDAGTVELGATASAGTINWYADSTGGASLGSGTSYTTPSIASTTTYYVDATDNGCTTASRTAVTATVNPLPLAAVSYFSCAGVDGKTTIKITGSGGTSPYFYKVDGGSYQSSETFMVNNGSNHDYYVKDVYGCESSAVNFTPTSYAPTQIAGTGSSATCACGSVSENRDIYLANEDGLIAIINDKGHNLGTVTAHVFIHKDPVVVTDNQGNEQIALSRSFLLDFTGTNLTPNVEVKFPFTDQEFNDLVAATAASSSPADNVTYITDLRSTQYEGPTEDSIYNTSDATLLLAHEQVENGTILDGKYIMVALSANGEHWLHGNSNGAPLPVKLTKFTAKAINNDAVKVEWVTSLEINNDYFTIERSTNGINFEMIGKVDGAGNSTKALAYSFMDVNPMEGISYYRLKQTDYDGQFSYSNIATVTIGSNGTITLFPNPANDVVNINLNNLSSEAHLKIYDEFGKLVFAQTYAKGAPHATNTITLNLKDMLANGVYFVDINSNGTNFKQKLIVSQQ
jgi:hypothetical protein